MIYDFADSRKFPPLAILSIRCLNPRSSVPTEFPDASRLPRVVSNWYVSLGGGGRTHTTDYTTRPARLFAYIYRIFTLMLRSTQHNTPIIISVTQEATGRCLGGNISRVCADLTRCNAVYQTARLPLFAKGSTNLHGYPRPQQRRGSTADMYNWINRDNIKYAIVLKREFYAFFPKPVHEPFQSLLLRPMRGPGFCTSARVG